MSRGVVRHRILILDTCVCWRKALIETIDISADVHEADTIEEARRLFREYSNFIAVFTDDEAPACADGPVERTELLVKEFREAGFKNNIALISMDVPTEAEWRGMGFSVAIEKMRVNAHTLMDILVP